ncbi:hypothetical protein ACIA5D_47080 [Actinoplanes sp. NPDC051513]|uniref:hypothetical protein n=1 Tax=Actinoplanes sp. NPDC051513 TaxID=3363908 RepID=UPI0037AE8251
MDEDPKPEPVATVTMLDKANQFRTKAVLIEAQQSDTDELARLTHRVAAVKAALQKLDRAMTAARIVSDLPDSPTINMAVDDGYHDFRRNVETSNFNDTVFRAATRKLEAASTQFDTDAQQVWKTWAAQRLGSLRWERIAVLPAAERRSVRERWTRLDRIAASSPDKSSVTEFVTTYANMRELLDDLPDLPSQLVDLLDRLSQKTPLTIADLSEEDLRILRESEVGSQIELRRRES